MNAHQKDFTEKHVLNHLISLKDSTTLYLEGLYRQKLQVLIESQEESFPPGPCIITRLAKLYFNSPDRASVYCISSLDKENLSYPEYCLVSEGETPLGKIFLQYKREEVISKKNITVVQETDKKVASFLNVDSDLLYRKTYDYWIGSRRVGKIIEFFNEESIMRI